MKCHYQTFFYTSIITLLSFQFNEMLEFIKPQWMQYSARTHTNAWSAVRPHPTSFVQCPYQSAARVTLLVKSFSSRYIWLIFLSFIYTMHNFDFGKFFLHLKIVKLNVFITWTFNKCDHKFKIWAFYNVIWISKICILKHEQFLNVMWIS